MEASKNGCIRDAKFVSVWNDGFHLETDCKVNVLTHEIFDIQKIENAVDDEGDELEMLHRQYVIVDGKEYCAGSAYSETVGWNPDTDYWYK